MTHSLPSICWGGMETAGWEKDAGGEKAAPPLPCKIPCKMDGGLGAGWKKNGMLAQSNQWGGYPPAEERPRLRRRGGGTGAPGGGPLAAPSTPPVAAGGGG